MKKFRIIPFVFVWTHYVQADWHSALKIQQRVDENYIPSTDYTTNADYMTNAGYPQSTYYTTNTGYTPRASYTSRTRYLPSTDYPPRTSYTTNAGYTPRASYTTNAGYTPRASYTTNAGYTSRTSYPPSTDYPQSRDYTTNAGYTPRASYTTNAGYTPRTSYPPSRDYTTNTYYTSRAGYTTDAGYTQNTVYDANTMRTNPADEKNKFFEAACRDENDYYVKNMHTKPTSEAISFPSRWFSPKSTKKPSISYANDSVYEMLFLMSQGKRVAANTAANAKCIGGGFSTMWKHRKGKGSQEEGVMALLSGHLTSLLKFAKRDSKGHLLRIDNDSNQGRFNYKTNTLAKNIILSKNLHTRIRMDLLDDYQRDRRNCKFFADYVAHRYSLDKSVLSHDTSYTIDIYSIAALDGRGLSRPITTTRYNQFWTDTYNQLRTDTYNQISTMLKSAKSRNTYSVVVTVPGSGVFSNIGYGSNAKKDTTYLGVVKKAVMAAIEKHGCGLKEIIICGLR